MDRLLIGFIAGAIAIAGTLIIFAFWWSAQVCEAATKDIGLQHRWSNVGGCQVRTKQGWVPLSNYRVF